MMKLDTDNVTNVNVAFRAMEKYLVTGRDGWEICVWSVQEKIFVRL